jgi:hypothetical protein
MRKSEVAIHIDGVDDDEVSRCELGASLKGVVEVRGAKRGWASLSLRHAVDVDGRDPAHGRSVDGRVVLFGDWLQAGRHEFPFEMVCGAPPSYAGNGYELSRALEAKLEQGNSRVAVRRPVEVVAPKGGALRVEVKPHTSKRWDAGVGAVVYLALFATMLLFWLANEAPTGGLWAGASMLVVLLAAYGVWKSRPRPSRWFPQLRVVTKGPTTNTETQPSYRTSAFATPDDRNDGAVECVVRTTETRVR